MPRVPVEKLRKLMSCCVAVPDTFSNVSSRAEADKLGLAAASSDLTILNNEQNS